MLYFCVVRRNMNWSHVQFQRPGLSIVCTRLKPCPSLRLTWLLFEYLRITEWIRYQFTTPLKLTDARCLIEYEEIIAKTERWRAFSTATLWFRQHGSRVWGVVGWTREQIDCFTAEVNPYFVEKDIWLLDSNSCKRTHHCLLNHLFGRRSK